MPFTALLAVALLLAILEIKLFVYVLIIGYMGALFTVPAAVILGLQEEAKEEKKMDCLYQIILTYVATLITMAIMSKILLSIIQQLMYNYVSTLFTF